MNQVDILQTLESCKVLLHGHFQLTSGKHSDSYMQCARLFEHPQQSKALCTALAEQIEKINLGKIDLVVGPAIGGIIMAYQMAECLGVNNIFAERDQQGVMTFRRGFEVQKGQRVLVCEDVVTTGGSVKEVLKLLVEAGAEIVAVASIVDRSAGQANFGVPFEALVRVDFAVYEPQDCPLCKASGQAIKPGSRK